MSFFPPFSFIKKAKGDRSSFISNHKRNSSPRITCIKMEKRTPWSFFIYRESESGLNAFTDHQRAWESDFPPFPHIYIYIYIYMRKGWKITFSSIYISQSLSQAYIYIYIYFFFFFFFVFACFISFFNV